MHSYCEQEAVQELIVQQWVRGTAFLAASTPLSTAGTYILAMEPTNNTLQLSVNASAFMTIAGPGGFGTLDLAYDGPAGAGAGRTITADSGAVVINDNAANNNNVLELNKSPAGAQSGSCLVATVGGALVTSAASAAILDFRGNAGTVLATNGVLNIQIGAATALTAGGANPLVGCRNDLLTNLTANDNHVCCLRCSVAASTRADTAGEAAILLDSRAIRQRALELGVRNTGGTLAAIRYTAATALGAALTGLLLDFGPATLDSAGQVLRCVDIQMTAVQTGAVANQGIRLQRTGVPAAASTWSGDLLRLDNTPTGTNAHTSSGSIINIQHVPTPGAGAVTDSTIGVNIAMTPEDAGATCRGIVIAMGPNATGAGAAPIAAAVAAANEETMPVLILNGINFYVGQLTPPVVAAPDDSFFFNTGGTWAANNVLYHRQGGAWVAAVTT